MALSFSSPELRRSTVVALLRLEGIVILALGLFLIVKGLISGGSIEWFVISGILALALVGGFGLLFAAKGFKTKKMYGRAPAVLANLIAIGVSKYQFAAGLYIVAIPLFILAVVTVVSVLRAIPDRLPTS